MTQLTYTPVVYLRNSSLEDTLGEIINVYNQTINKIQSEGFTVTDVTECSIYADKFGDTRMLIVIKVSA